MDGMENVCMFRMLLLSAMVVCCQINFLLLFFLSLHIYTYTYVYFHCTPILSWLSRMCAPHIVHDTSVASEPSEPSKLYENVTI